MVNYPSSSMPAPVVEAERAELVGEAVVVAAEAARLETVPLPGPQPLQAVVVVLGPLAAQKRSPLRPHLAGIAVHKLLYLQYSHRCYPELGRSPSEEVPGHQKPVGISLLR